ncbi:Fe-S protein [Vibrio sp. UCD-FRSSP16_10]|uniref:DUF1289 domain-containing protein n=1 Tax=unclassified Vibrio TaxID=2614977 RepID=UPI0007FE942B|nr:MULTISPECIES: DUF1289 domain-containing protein [unclassified Vibrio]OBT13469.1 Fe-S protein [Vibrio sp. UCD-FRSSP16_10]OBT17978.1 Fe-S protein [Vibrio sp. UCD-FRSSP16_30]
MEQLDFFDVPSPCVGVCRCDEKGYCKGCMRNRDERFSWQTFTATQKMRVIKLCRQRYRRKVLKNAATVTQPNDDENTQQSLF